jgi:tRNA(Ile2) C34 agmatinyltransferase TiaS
MQQTPYCKKCGHEMYWNGYASMGSSHSNYYRCSNCRRCVEIYDSDLKGDTVIKKLKF